MVTKNRIPFYSLEKVYISAVTTGELFYGAYKSSRTQDNIKLFKSFLLEYPLLDITQEVSEIYGEIKFQLFKKGQLGRKTTYSKQTGNINNSVYRNLCNPS
jgi:predicted nucleic acid-binding protein